MKKSSVLALVSVAVFAGIACADFSGDYAPANWSLGSSSNGFVDVHDATTLVLVGTDDGTNTFGWTDLRITVPQTGLISFDWAYSSSDEHGVDRGLYYANSTAWVLLSDTNGQSGTVSNIAVSALDSFIFTIESEDSLFGPGVLVVTNFGFTTVPTPGALAMLGLAGLATGRRRAR